jgi:signal transduction histidine kinase
MWKTLRFRLAIWNVCVVAFTALATLAGLRQGVRWAILHEMDQILAEDVQEISLALQRLPSAELYQLTEDLKRKAIGHRQHGWFVQLITGDQVIWSSPQSPNLTPLAAIHAEALSDSNYRVVSRVAPSNPVRIERVRVGASLDFLQDDMARIDRLSLLGGGIVMILAPLLGYWLAGRAAKTIGEITLAAELLRPSRIEDRLPIRGTGDELDRLAGTINGLLDRIAAYLGEKRDLLANAAHELRTPLAAIRSSVEVALASERSNEEYQELLVEIIDQGESLETLVNQLLVISESEAEQLRLDREPIAFDETVCRSAEMFAGVAESRNIEMKTRISAPVRIRGNGHLLKQLVNNLIDNAIKYTPPGGRVAIELSQDDASHTAQLSVVDTGIGISETDIPKVFDRFFRADKSRTRLTETVGTGLGLSIGQAVALAHQGRIQCESQVDCGSRFTVELPLA